MPLNILVLPLLGGYLFLRKYYVTKFALNRTSGRRVLLDAARIGLLLFLLSRGIVLVTIETLPSLGNWWKDLAPFAYSGTALLSAALGHFSGCVGNGILDGRAKQELSEDIYKLATDPGRLLAIVKDVRREDDHIERTLLKCWAGNQPVMITTKRRKVYVGAPKHGPEPHEERREIAILPLLSGYRNPDTLEVEFTTTYADTYERMTQSNISMLKPGEFVTVIPIEELSALSLFDFDAYDAFQRNASERGIEEEDIEKGRHWTKTFSG